MALEIPQDDCINWGSSWTTNFQRIDTLYSNTSSGTFLSSVTVQGNAFSVGGSSFTVSGGSATVAYSLTVGALVANTPITGHASLDVTKTGDTMTGQLTLSGSTLTVTGNALSVGGSSFTVAGGSATVAYRLTPGSINMTGPSGTLTSQSSITASAFFGDGSNVSGIGAIAGANTWTGANAFSSSLTVNGGTFGTLDRSSQTINVPNFSISSTTFGTCVSNSSVTYSFQGAGAAYGYVTATIGAASGDMGVVFILDGAYAGGATSAKTTCGCVSSSLGICDVTCYMNLGQKASGSHTLCVSIAGTSGGVIAWNNLSTFVGNVVRLEQR